MKMFYLRTLADLVTCPALYFCDLKMLFLSWIRCIMYRGFRMYDVFIPASLM